MPPNQKISPHQSSINLLSRSVDETLEIGRILGQILQPGMVLAMYGELGSGKTVLAKGIGRGLEAEDEITSPSFVIMNVYSGRIPIYHFDFYRLNSILQLDDLGLDEFFYGDGVSLVEWADRLGERLPRGSIEVSLKRVSFTTDSLRQIALRSSEQYEADFAGFLEDGNVEKRG